MLPLLVTVRVGLAASGLLVDCRCCDAGGGPGGGAMLDKVSSSTLLLDVLMGTDGDVASMLSKDTDGLILIT